MFHYFSLVSVKMLFGVVLCMCTLSSAFNVTDYLTRYGYLSLDETSLRSEKLALSAFQSYYKLPDDGEINEETLTFMNTPRCGVSDGVLEFRTGFNWTKNVITWNIKPVRYIAYAVKAFDVWAQHVDLTFKRQTYGVVDLNITFVNNRNYTHGTCQFKMDSRVLGHAFLPDGNNSPLEIHINDITWGDKPPTHNLMYTLIHEIGHALGLLHSDEQESIMYALYKEQRPSLHQDDILAVQYLYPPKQKVYEPIRTTTVAPTVTTVTTPQITTVPTAVELRNFDICQYPVQEVQFLVVHTNLYIFHKNNLWIMDLKSKRLTTKYANINTLLKFLPKFNQITAIYQRPNDNIVAVINSEIFEIGYPGFQLLRRYNISHFDSMFSKKMVGIVNTNRGKTFIFFQDNYYTQLDERTFVTVGADYISRRFEGIPVKFDRVFRYIDGHIYFLQGNRFFEYDEFQNSLIESSLISFDKFGIDCPSLTLYEQLKILLQKILKYNQ